MGIVLRVVAIIFFVFAAFIYWTLIESTSEFVNAGAFLAAGLACWCGSTLPWVSQSSP